MYRSKVVKKKTRNRQTLLRNLNKGKARKQPRCGFELIPYPLKYPYKTDIHYLYADVPLLEVNNNLALECSLYNSYKLYKNAHIQEYPNQKVIRVQLENRVNPPVDWKKTVEKLEHSESEKLKQWVNPITNFCQRYEEIIKQFKADQVEISEERLQMLTEINAKTEKIKESLVKTYPFIEFKSQLRGDEIQVVEISFSEKYLKELGYDIDSFSSVIFQEGIPEMIPSDSESAVAVARFRLLKYLTIDPDGYQTPEFESMVVMKGGYIKKIKMKVHYLTCYEKGVPGFTFVGVVLGKQKPHVAVPKNISEGEGESVIGPEFVTLMKQKEQEMAHFLKEYYNEKGDEKYTNLHKTCQIKELPVDDHEQM